MPKAIWKDVIIAESENTVVVEGNHYFPADSIKQEYFHKTEHKTICGWKGEASYYTIEVDNEKNENAAWFYPQTKPEAKNIEGYVAFWKGVDIQA